MSNMVRATSRNPQRSSTSSLSNQYSIGKKALPVEFLPKTMTSKKRLKSTSEGKEDRVEFGEDMLLEDGDRISNASYSDEKRYSLFDAHRDRVRVPPGKKLKADLHKKCEA